MYWQPSYLRSSLLPPQLSVPGESAVYREAPYSLPCVRWRTVCVRDGRCGWKGVSGGGWPDGHDGRLGEGVVGSRVPWVEEEDWDQVANMDPQGDELDRLCDQHPAPEEWQKEWDG